MPPSDRPELRCPDCQSVIPTEEEWRLVRCLSCGRVVSRMEDDASYD